MAIDPPSLEAAGGQVKISMEKNYDHLKHERDIYQKWESSGAFKAKGTGTPYTVLMPPPNANASLHAGHAMYTIDDIMVRWKRMQGYSAVWIPGMDHAGFETQFVYEKELAKQGKSRMDFDRKTLYQNIFDFVKKNSGLIYEQFKRLGFSADWERSVFTLDDSVLNRVFETFKRMESEGHVYRDEYIVNYCTHCGTSLAELEVENEERIDSLYYIRYNRLEKEEGYVVVATTRPEPIWADTHLAVNAKDKKNKKLIGETVLNPITGKEMEIIGDDFVDPEFGTGIVKMTPAHDTADFEVARKHGLPVIQAIDLRGKMMEGAGKFAGLKVEEARKKTVEELQMKGLVEKIDENYQHTVKLCYRCHRILEPMVVPNWFIKVADLKKPVIIAVGKDEVSFYPKRYKSQMSQWLKIMHDWPISRQIVWGIRIPVWYEIEDGASNLWVWWLDRDGKMQQGNVRQFLETGTPLSEIEEGLQRVNALTGTNAPRYVVAVEKPGGNYLPETDTFDTWFSSGQWPLVTLKNDEYASRLPTDFMGTLADILKFWISRMMMFSLYLENKIPYRNVYLWSMVADAKGIKMSKSKGNVINPIELVDKYGADALRMTLLYGTPAGSKVNLAEDKVRGMRNFSNKIWNAARFLLMLQSEEGGKNAALKDESLEFQKHINDIVNKVTKYLESFQLSYAADLLYEEFWHWYCDVAIENAKVGMIRRSVMLSGLTTFLKLLHPFMPFVTEAVWQSGRMAGIKEFDSPTLIEARWPEV